MLSAGAPAANSTVLRGSATVFRRSNKFWSCAVSGLLPAIHHSIRCSQPTLGLDASIRLKTGLVNQKCQLRLTSLMAALISVARIAVPRQKRRRTISCFSAEIAILPAVPWVVDYKSRARSSPHSAESSPAVRVTGICGKTPRKSPSPPSAPEWYSGKRHPTPSPSNPQEPRRPFLCCLHGE